MRADFVGKKVGCGSGLSVRSHILQMDDWVFSLREDDMETLFINFVNFDGIKVD